MSAGSDASDELELNATAWAGSAARTNPGSETCPPNAPTMQSTTTSVIIIAMYTTA